MFTIIISVASLFFFFNDPATTEIYTLSLHDALPISVRPGVRLAVHVGRGHHPCDVGDRKSTRLNSSHVAISYAGVCLKKKKTTAPPRNWPAQRTEHRSRESRRATE